MLIMAARIPAYFVICTDTGSGFLLGRNEMENFFPNLVGREMELGSRPSNHFADGMFAEVAFSGSHSCSITEVPEKPKAQKPAKASLRSRREEKAHAKSSPQAQRRRDIVTARRTPSHAATPQPATAANPLDGNLIPFYAELVKTLQQGLQQRAVPKKTPGSKKFSESTDEGSLTVVPGTEVTELSAQGSFLEFPL